MAVGLQTAAGGSVAGLGDAAARALAKLEQVLPSRLRRRLATLRSSIVGLADAGPTVELTDVSLLATACAERRELRFLYRDHGGASTTRTVEPHRIVHTGRRWYLVAWDRDRDDWRTFRIDRVRETSATGAHFMQRSSPDDDVGAYVSRGITESVYKVRARVVLHGPARGRAPAGPRVGRSARGHRRCNLRPLHGRELARHAPRLARHDRRRVRGPRAARPVRPDDPPRGAPEPGRGQGLDRDRRPSSRGQAACVRGSARVLAGIGRHPREDRRHSSRDPA